MARLPAGHFFYRALTNFFTNSFASSKLKLLHNILENLKLLLAQPNEIAIATDIHLVGWPCQRVLMAEVATPPVLTLQDL
jgi:hypothetical protein